MGERATGEAKKVCSPVLKRHRVWSRHDRQPTLDRIESWTALVPY